VKISKRHIVYAWIVMICFIAGQWAVYAHYHKASKVISHTSSNSHAKTSVSEKCQLCDAMHHNNMARDIYGFIMPIVSADYFYQQGHYNFVSVSLVLSAGRAPPLS
jgi:hypothetical protein